MIVVSYSPTQQILGISVCVCYKYFILDLNDFMFASSMKKNMNIIVVYHDIQYSFYFISIYSNKNYIRNTLIFTALVNYRLKHNREIFVTTIESYTVTCTVSY